MALLLRLRSRALPAGTPGRLVTLSGREAGWKYVNFAVRRLGARESWKATTGRHEACLVLLAGQCRISCDGQDHQLGPRADVFRSYPHAVYLPPGTPYRVTADLETEIAECKAPATKHFEVRVIRPNDCGFEVRGGGNATRQIIDVMPPSFPAHRLMICEVLTPGGNWSSYPPHKHDTDDLPREAELEETYYYRFQHPDAYGVQRLYGPDDRGDRVLTVRHGDVVLIRSGYHPFVGVPGFDAYYLNVLAGPRRSMASSDDPRYADMRRHWPPPDPRVPLIEPPYRV